MSSWLIWFLVGVGFLAAEFFIPAFVLIFFTAGSWITAFGVFFFALSLPVQMGLFILSSLLLLVLLRRYSLKVFRGETGADDPDNYVDSKLGKTAQVTKALGPFQTGEVKVAGSFWRAVCDTAVEQGQWVKVVGQDENQGLTLRVKPIEGEQHD